MISCDDLLHISGLKVHFIVCVWGEDEWLICVLYLICTKKHKYFMFKNVF